MKRTIAVPILLLVGALPALAAGSPQQLVEVLAQAAREGDVEKFIAHMSQSSQRALDETEATRKRLQESHKNFEASLDEQFGAGHRVRPPTPPDRRAILSRLVGLELMSAEEIGPNEARLRLKTTSKDPRGRVRTEENALKAVKEGGQWKLEWADVARAAGHASATRASALRARDRANSRWRIQRPSVGLDRARKSGKRGTQQQGGTPMMRVLIALSVLLFLSGCPPTPVQLKTINLQWSQLSWNDAEDLYIGFWCDFSIQSNGLGPSYSSGSDNTLSGYEDFYDSGSGPFPCVQNGNIYYRGGFAFDLSQFDSVVAATLTFDVENSISANGEVVGQIPPACNATTLGTATGTDYYYFDNPVSLPPCGPSYSIDVSSQVRDWINQSHANYGFMLAGPKLDFPNNVDQDNSAKITWYTNFQLAVLYNPALNPRAPQ